MSGTKPLTEVDKQKHLPFGFVRTRITPQVHTKWRYHAPTNESIMPFINAVSWLSVLILILMWESKVFKSMFCTRFTKKAMCKYINSYKQNQVSQNCSFHVAPVSHQRTLTLLHSSCTTSGCTCDLPQLTPTVTHKHSHTSCCQLMHG